MTAMVCASWVLPHPSSVSGDQNGRDVVLTKLSINLIDAHSLEATVGHQYFSDFSNGCRRAHSKLHQAAYYQ
jgi:hypothetical protein